MNERQVHIVCFDIPYPVTHGGYFDLFYKIKALHQQGVQITLHCFQYGRNQQSILNRFCKVVHYYKRLNIFKSISFKLPFIVASRINQILINNLAKDKAPIILEGTHCTYILYKNLFPGRKIIFRLHNIEHIYYRQLYLSEKSISKKIYYWFESRLLKKYEKIVAKHATIVLAVAPLDIKKIRNYCPTAFTIYLPVFLGKRQIESKEGTGPYCLYHGNLSINENEEVCIHLIQTVFSKIKIPLIIAGRNPTHRIQHMVLMYKNIRLIANPSEAEMKELIQNAHINLIISYNATGIKLKLINALFYGRHCVVNKAAIEGTELESCCIVISSMQELLKVIPSLLHKPYTNLHNKLKHNLLSVQFDDNGNAQKLMKLLY